VTAKHRSAPRERMVVAGRLLERQDCQKCKGTGMRCRRPKEWCLDCTNGKVWRTIGLSVEEARVGEQRTLL
jgi:hypothetical protein